MRVPAPPRRSTPAAVAVAALLIGAVGLGMGAAQVAGPPGWTAQGSPEVQLRPVLTNLDQPLHVAHAGDRSGRLFVVEQAGVIRVMRDGRLLPAPFLDIRRRVIAGGEMGLLSVAFHPRYAANGRFFVNYTSQEGGLKTVIAEYRVSRANPDVADPTERVLLEIAQPFRNHNGGLNLFGPDGMLYIGMGDGGSAGDPMNNGQRLDTLLGKLLRIDVDGETPYRSPPDNPFSGRADARPEIWAYGLRNPWRFSFDRVTGRLHLGDVGQNALEEVDLVERGGNYGWNTMEGSRCYRTSTCSTAGLRPPIAEYAHAEGCSVTGGLVYRGSRIRGLVGRYLFGDYCSGRMWALAESGAGRWIMSPLLQTSLGISSFGEDQDGDAYVVDLRGGLYLLTGR
jgi:glucose/arabinose dehydrogenase